MDLNSYCYLGLGFLSLILLIYVYWKIRSPRIFLLLLATIGLGFLIEAVIYNFSLSYQYYPHIIKHDPIYDSNLGAVASNAFSLPIVATFIATFRKKWPWLLFFTGLFVGIELLFLHLDIYKHNWWRIEYTAIGLPFYFATAKLLYQKLSQPLTGIWHNLLLYLNTGPILGLLHIFPIMFFNMRYYKLGWFENTSQDTNAFATIYYLIISFVIVMITKYHWNHKVLKYAILPILITVITLILSKMKILHSLVWWDKYYYIFFPIIVLLIAQAISNRLILGPSERKT